VSETSPELLRKLATASDLQSVVRTMKALAASNIGQYQRSVRSLEEYNRAVELGLGAALRASPASDSRAPAKGRPGDAAYGAIVFGSDQGLVGQFNDVVADFALKHFASLPGRPNVWAVGERVHARLADAGVQMVGLFPVPGSVEAIPPLVGQIQIESEAHRAAGDYARVFVFHNQPRAGALYVPVALRLLPLDAQWRARLSAIPWPTHTLPEVLSGGTVALRALIREYLFISLFRASAESLASENASRLAAMQRADKNIDDLIDGLQTTFHRVRQTAIDEELFDVTSGFEALSKRQAP
jgi:F-type H+-transporting ATPase subunit gamma